jgi:hypothetical protein
LRVFTGLSTRTAPPEVVASWPHPNYVNPETQGPALTYVCIVFTSFSFFLVTARIYARLLITKALGLDDLFCILSLVSPLRTAAMIELTYLRSCRL